jgi:hypothetical protein
MERHCNKKRSCEPEYNALFPLAESKKLSLGCRYYFIENTDESFISSLHRIHKIKLVTSFNEPLNIIKNDMTKYDDSLYMSMFIEKNLTNSIKMIEDSPLESTRLADLRSAASSRDMSAAGSTPIGDLCQSSILLASKGTELTTCNDRHKSPIGVEPVADMSLRPSAPLRGDKKVQHSWELRELQKVAGSRQSAQTYKGESILTTCAATLCSRRESTELTNSFSPTKHCKQLCAEAQAYEDRSNRVEEEGEKEEEEGEEEEEIVRDPKDAHIIYVNGTRFYQCPECEGRYTRKENLIKHLKKPEKCQDKKTYNESLMKSTYIAQFNQFINNNNIQNVQNVQNNQMNKNTFNYAICDFFKEDYRYDHIKDDIFEKRDFFLLNNFFGKLLENDANKNVYFDNKSAFLYTGNAIKRIPVDRASYIIIEKIDKALRHFLYDKACLSSEELTAIERYYTVLQRKFCNDTTYREYDPETHTYQPCKTGHSWTRDVCISEMSKCLYPHKELMMKMFREMGCDNSEIDSYMKIAIEGYESERMRLKHFVDDGKQFK